MLRVVLTYQTIALIIAFLLPSGLFNQPDLTQTQQIQKIEWQDENFFTKADQKAIQVLAKTIGIQNPKQVYRGEYLPSLCPYVMMESAYSESGHLRTHFQLTIHRQDWKCMKPDKATRKRVGRWLASTTELQKRSEWKIEENQWAKYVFFEDGVSYQDAALIVLAIKHRQLVNRSQESIGPTINPMDITSIQIKTKAERTFEIQSSYGGSGEIYEVRINEGSVEFLRMEIWMA